MEYYQHLGDTLVVPSNACLHIVLSYHKNPPFILLDEATASLDTLTENSVQVALDRLGAQRTVLVIAHRLGTSKFEVLIAFLRYNTYIDEV